MKGRMFFNPLLLLLSISSQRISDKRTWKGSNSLDSTDNRFFWQMDPIANPTTEEISKTRDIPSSKNWRKMYL